MLIKCNNNYKVINLELQDSSSQQEIWPFPVDTYLYSGMHACDRRQTYFLR